MFPRREHTDWLILSGEFQDFWEISSYDLMPRTERDFQREIEIGRGVLRSFRRSLPHAPITWVEGNHEFRLRKYLIQNAKELYGLPGVSVPDIFDLRRLEIEYDPATSWPPNSPITLSAWAISTSATGTGCRSTAPMQPKF